ncbi:hypothetical protein [Xenophilus sp. Marseille-Q4582]|uniref:hypothetical protein n=1 Tax=Xenophilus sp. Marseille-Q4582 TaxID=2866600 RepID=UPI001CE421B9|nr:hypothetical protein [Xenophilus sp. Marseille-Q4582]
MRVKTLQTMTSLRNRCIEEGECWLWQGYFGNGVPAVSHGGKMMPVRAVMVDLLGIRVERARYFAPKCGCADCVNPEHIGQYTQAQHMAKMGRKVDSKGPGRRLKLTQHARATKAKITIEIAREIRLSPEPGPVLAERYGITRSVVGRIRRGEAWADTQNPFWRLAA